jgi:cell wall-associated NlpC family hydrolase
MKNVFFVLVFLVFAGKNLSSQAINPIADSVVAYAKTFLGTPYKYASANPKAGFDCSGFAYFVFAHYGITLPRSAKDYANFGKEIPISECRKGDLILFRGTHPNDKHVGHVGIVISNKGEPLQFIHSSSSKNHNGVVITNYANSHYPARFIKIIRVIN